LFLCKGNFNYINHRAAKLQTADRDRWGKWLGAPRGVGTRAVRQENWQSNQVSSIPGASGLFSAQG